MAGVYADYPLPLVNIAKMVNIVKIIWKDGARIVFTSVQHFHYFHYPGISELSILLPPAYTISAIFTIFTNFNVYTGIFQTADIVTTSIHNFHYLHWDLQAHIVSMSVYRFHDSHYLRHIPNLQTGISKQSKLLTPA